MKDKQLTIAGKNQPEPSVSMTLEQYESVREVSYALCELDGVLNHSCDLQEPAGSIVKIISGKLFASLEEVQDDEGNAEAIRAANRGKD